MGPACCSIAAVLHLVSICICQHMCSSHLLLFLVAHGLVQAVLTGQPVDQTKTRGFLLPLFREGQTNGPNCAGVTTANNTIVMRGSRGYALLQPFNKSLLLDVVLACKKQGDRMSKAVVNRLAVSDCEAS